jgi:hypothetical protein
MNEIRIKITGPDSTFGAITKTLELLFKEVGADVELVLDRESAIMSLEETKDQHKQVLGRKIIIETKSLPWGG